MAASGGSFVKGRGGARKFVKSNRSRGSGAAGSPGGSRR